MTTKLKNLKKAITFFTKTATSTQKNGKDYNGYGNPIGYLSIDPQLRKVLSRQEYLIGYCYGLIGNNGHKGSIIKNAVKI